jgi:hypothetical protein
MVRLVGEWELARWRARQARRTAEVLSWERELDRLNVGYREVCEGDPGQAGEVGNTQVTVVPRPR